MTQNVAPTRTVFDDSSVPGGIGKLVSQQDLLFNSGRHCIGDAILASLRGSISV